MINLTTEAIINLLKKHDYDASIQEETQQVYTILKVEKEYPLFIRVFDEGHLLQLLVFIPTDFKKEAICDMARLLHLLNKELDVPGFGMDEKAAIVFYRVMLPTPKKKIDSELLLAYLKTIEHVCQMFATPIEAVGFGQATLDEILQKAEELDNNK
jgi:hypothetical protein